MSFWGYTFLACITVWVASCCADCSRQIDCAESQCPVNMRPVFLEAEATCVCMVQP